MDKGILLAKKAYTISELQQIIARAVEQTFSNTINTLILSVEGILGEIKDNGSYSVYYSIPLRDEIGNLILLDIPKKLIDVSYSSRKVTVTGVLKCKFWKNTPNIRMEVSAVKLHTEIDPMLLEKEKTLVEVVKDFKDYSKTFPVRDVYSITLIHPSTGDVKNDFLRQLTGIKNITIKTYPVNIFSLDEIKQVIKDTTGDIVIIIRGGGDDAGFEVFNDRELLEVWGSKDVYRISALGHTSQRFLLDLFSDASCDTPTAAGIFIKEHIEAIELRKKYEETEKNYKAIINQLNEEQKKYKEEMVNIQKKYSEDMAVMQKKKDEDIGKYVSELIKTRDQMIEQQTKFTHMLAESEKQISLIKKEYSGKLLNQKRILIIQCVIILLAIIYILLWK